MASVQRQDSGDTTHMSEGTGLSRIRVAKNRPKEKPGNCCNIISETSQCKLSVTALDTERPGEEVRRERFQEASSQPSQLIFTWLG